jgi:hypothetical protein
LAVLNNDVLSNDCLMRQVAYYESRPKKWT